MENLLKNQRISKYENDCLTSFLLHFMSLLTAKFVRKQPYLGQNLLYLSKKCPKKKLEML